MGAAWVRQMWQRAIVMVIAALLGFAFPIGAAVSAAGTVEDVPAAATGGVLDVREDAVRPGAEGIPLHGEWEFYWHQLLKPEQLHSGAAETPSVGIEVPGSWQSQQASVFGGTEDVRYGYGTYRLQVQLPPEDVGRSQALYIRSVGSAYRLWVDGEEQPGLGIVGTSRDEETPQAHANLIFITPDSEHMELVLQVSNHSFREGGIISEMRYGDPTAMNVHLLKMMFKDIFVVGGLALFGLFHLIVYSFRRHNLPTLLVGLVTLAMSARTLFLNGYLSRLVLGIESWELLVRLEYLVENAGFLFLVLLIQKLYPKDVNRLVLYAAYGLAAALSLFVLLTPAVIYTQTMLAQTLTKAAILAYFVCYIGIVAFIRKREGAVINLTATLLILVAIINDMLLYERVVYTVELVGYSAVVFILAQAVIVSYRYNRLAQRNHALVVELGEMNESLEQRVRQRTQKLREVNEELVGMKDIRTKMLVNIAHDLHSPLTGVQTYLHLMNKGVSMADRPNVVRQLIDKTSYIQRLIRDLFELSKLETKERSFAFERVDAREWLEDVHQQFADELPHAGMELRRGRWEEDDGEARLVAIDRNRIMQVLQNYIDNAIKFSRGHSSVLTMHLFTELHPASGQEQLVVEIEDQGEGIPEDQLTQVFSRFYKKRTDNEEGSGLGLAIVAEIMEQHGGTVGVRSREGEGSVFGFTLPLV